jgi:hypothetical protein
MQLTPRARWIQKFLPNPPENELLRGPFACFNFP